ncbi:sensor histidine kinase [Rhodococcus sp. NPDC060086]|uniref:sensor histidine kinase n=1 Tax=Rhodococcus sp. NPDC060086 TaxID=3347055 RepID=UPI0036565711
MIDRYAAALIALAYFVCGAVLYLLDLGALVAHDETSVQVRLVLLAAVCVPMLLRRSHPLLGLALASVPVAVDFALGMSLPVWIAYGDLLFAAALYGTARTSVFLERAPIAPIAILAVGAGIYTGELRPAVFVAAMGALLISLPVWWARSVRTHRDAAEAERVKAQALAQVAELDRAAAITAERQHLARDLHDIVAGHLSAIAIQSEAALRLRERDPQKAMTVLESVRTNSVEALREMQSMVTLLRSEDTRDDTATAGRLADLSGLVSSAGASGNTVTIDARELPELDAEVDVTAYRIIQEALTNATKHAPGQPVLVCLAADRRELTIRISNPLVPANTRTVEVAPDSDTACERGERQGLRNIAERAAAIGGGARSRIVDDQWRTEVHLPLRNGAAR